MIFSPSNTVFVSFNEDNWKRKNRVIYIGEGGQVLADVSEPPGDRILVVSDPFLTSVEEATRRAEAWLNRLKYARQEVRLVVEKHLAENLDLGTIVTVDFPDLGLSERNMYVVGIEYPLDVKEYYARITVGGELEFFEQLLDELQGRDPTSLFGGGINIDEILGSLNALVTSLQSATRIQAGGRTIRVYNVPPMFYENGVNITLDSQGRITLISSATEGSFEFPWKPNSPLFTRWLRVQYSYEPNDGSVSADILLPDGTILFSNIPEYFDIPYLPRARGAITNIKDGWSVTNATVEEIQMGIIGFVALRFTKTADPMVLVWPDTKDADLDILRFLRLYFYTFDNQNITIKLYQDDSNYLSATINNTGGAWQRWDISTASMTKTGNPAKMNWIEITTSASILYIDTDYLLYPAQDERLRLKITLTRPSAGAQSPTINMAKFVWREGKT